ncbi:EF-hand calcium-binding domain-containing protein 14 isoform X2 [Ascaphus truei]|uniref:EF-hand calcium-binding domain-containing protein 14 isoform X2 n=1 Tax=Ascaphus truei TaxID=8439 RepID=UPI003F5A1102
MKRCILSFRGFYLQCCKICYPLCAFVMLAACVVACVGLAWMQVALKEDLDALKEKFRAMESSQKSSLEEIPSINEDLLTKQKQLDNLVTGDTGLYKLWINITEMNKQIALLTSAVNHLKSNIKSASDLINLPNTVEELQKSVATLGSTLTSVHHDVETMQTAADEQKKKVETLQKDVAKYATKDTVQLSTTSPDIGSRSMSLTQDILYLHNTIDDINATMLQYQRHNDLRLQSVDSTISNISQRVALLESDLQLVSKIEKANVSVSMGDNTTSPENAASSDLAENATRTETPRGTDKVDSPVSKLREKLQLIHALTDKQPTEEKSGTEMVTSRPTLARMSPRAVSAGRRGAIKDGSLPRISTEKDLEELFRKSVQGINGKLSYAELESLLGAGIPEPQYLKKFDTDEDDKYSFSELKSAVGA